LCIFIKLLNVARNRRVVDSRLQGIMNIFIHQENPVATLLFELHNYLLLTILFIGYSATSTTLPRPPSRQGRG